MSARLRAGRPQLVLRLRSQPPRPSDAQQQEALQQVARAVQAIQAEAPLEHCVETLYQSVETLCLFGQATQLYRKLQAWCAEHIQTQIRSLLKETYNDSSPASAATGVSSGPSPVLQPQQQHPQPSKRPRLASPTASGGLANEGLENPTAFLRRVDATWSTHCRQMMLLRSVFLYLDRSWSLVECPTLGGSMWELGVSLFAQNFNCHRHVIQRLVACTLELIQAERNGDVIDRALMKRVTMMLWQLNLYGSDWEREFLQATQAFYADESRRLVKSLTLSQYLAYVKRRLAEDTERVANYLDQTTWAPLSATMETVLISDHHADILAAGVEDALPPPADPSAILQQHKDPGTNLFTLLSAGQLQDLRQLYELLQLAGHLKPLQQQFYVWIKEAGRRILIQADDAPQRRGLIVPHLLAFKRHVDHVHRVAFASNPDMDWGIRGAFENFLNLKQDEPAELIARFIHGQLSSGRKATQVPGFADQDALFDLIMYLFRFIHSKDVFQEFYMSFLAQRLLRGRSVAMDAEVGMIARIKQECGSGYTSKLEGMFKDLNLSTQISQQFQKEMQQWPASDRPSFEISLAVLTTGNWPESPPLDLKLPRELTQILERFREAYLAKHQRRVLNWNHRESSCKLKARFSASQKPDLLCSAQQAAVLLLFNQQAELNFHQIKELSGISDPEDLRLVLYSLCCIPNVRPLSKKPLNKTVLDTDLFSVNRKFANQYALVQLPLVPTKSSQAAPNATMEKLMRNRNHAIDANLVRILKTQQTVAHNALIAALQAQVPFDVTVAAIKDRIASLLERDFMERDKENPQVYHYVA